MIIETENLSKVYKGKVAVQSVNLSVEKGQIYGFLGPNGAGKSTCIKMLIGLVFPTSGKGAVLSRPLGDVEAREKMGYLPELFRYQEWMTGEDLLNFHTSLYRLKPDKARNKGVLQRVGLWGQERFKVGSYSKGMQQRLGLACALLPNPELLFLDEPTSALDPIGRKDVRDIILSLRNEGTTVFFNSHLLSEVETICDSITIINKGVVAKSGLMKDLLQEKITLDISCDRISEDMFLTLKNRFDNNLQRRQAMPGARDGTADISGSSDTFGNEPDSNSESEKLNLTLKNREEIAEVAAYLVSQGVKLYGLTPHRETLESVFIKVVGEGEEPSKQ